MDYFELMAAVAVKPFVTHECPECGAAVKCGVDRGSRECWCFSVQAKELEQGDRCLCKDCLTGKK